MNDNEKKVINTGKKVVVNTDNTPVEKSIEQHMMENQQNIKTKTSWLNVAIIIIMIIVLLGMGFLLFNALDKNGYGVDKLTTTTTSTTTTTTTTTKGVVYVKPTTTTTKEIKTVFAN